MRSSIGHCVLCKKRNSSLNKQVMADLPQFSMQVNDPTTPNHLLLLRGTANLPPGLFSKKDCYTR